jgi:N-acetylglucosaminyl-diphospho-decaprenol L-rhamnosyltransferase
MPQLSVIIVNWNSKDYLRKCLESIYASTNGISFEIIVVDGASYDGCGEMLKREFPAVRFIQSEKNIGFSRANNLAFEQSSGASLLFLNPDTEVAGRAINVLHDALMKHKDAGGLAPKLLNTDLSLQTSCVQAVPTILNQAFNSQALKGVFPKTPLSGDQLAPVEIEVLPGACIMTRRETFEQAGRFDPGYFMYCEDVDLSCQFRRAGCKNYYIPAASIIHHGGGSSEQAVSKFSAVMMRESVWRFLNKTRGRYYGMGYRGSTMLAAMCRLFLLGILLPVRMVRGELTPARNSFRKWAAILSWSVGAETWIRRGSD